MIISPLTRGGYVSGPVYTSSPSGRAVLVAGGYTAHSRSEIIRVAINNADIRWRITRLCATKSIR